MICFHLVVADPIYACQSIASLLFGDLVCFESCFFYFFYFVVGFLVLLLCITDLPVSGVERLCWATYC